MGLQGGRLREFGKRFGRGGETDIKKGWKEGETECENACLGRKRIYGNNVAKRKSQKEAEGLGIGRDRDETISKSRKDTVGNGAGKRKRQIRE
jgi:hypothetical protein